MKSAVAKAKEGQKWRKNGPVCRNCKFLAYKLSGWQRKEKRSLRCTKPEGKPFAVTMTNWCSCHLWVE